jgi:hypothetical protein
MSSKPVLTIAGVLSIVNPLGLGGPGPIDFGDARVLEQLHEVRSDAIWVDTVALIGPTLAFGVGIGWYLMVRRTSVFALYGTVLSYLGLVFIVAQDALQLAFVSRLPDAYVAATDAVKPALLGVGDTLGYAIEVLANVGIVGYVGSFIMYLVTLRTPSIPRWIGGVGALSSGLAILSSLLVLMIPQVPILGIGRPIGILASIVVGFALGIIMLRWKESEPLAAA